MNHITITDVTGFDYLINIETIAHINTDSKNKHWQNITLLTKDEFGKHIVIQTSTNFADIREAIETSRSAR